MIDPTRRPTGRVILAGPDDRVLLFRFVPPEPWPREPAWHTPGGGIEAGETPAQAAVREALEETGHVLDPSTLGDPVAVNEGPWSNEGRNFYTVSTYFFVRVPAATVAPTALEHYEREEWRLGYRWWSAAELAATDERVFPPGLATLLPGLLSGARPAAPVMLRWIA
ncbi:ADP-ribose pyrophosphatase YjhB, NUDIX family [Nonomuraea solani]|uniref:ADP-ribose pyrophosphatase YjhB, NUDIX family n=1 Tax=Nonomuraea solani TaxID=1144553 RepID=A0A1H6E0V1_9ACTN|nr:NUDIX domain-containing protein [Nonomuraea solani]SEG91230.1 ADP-ribose pyrophosphatase YjhB, NUDIX family [Nonomuraea solani]